MRENCIQKNHLNVIHKIKEVKGVKIYLIFNLIMYILRYLIYFFNKIGHPTHIEKITVK